MTYPNSIYKQRELENLPGVEFDAENKKTLYAEDILGHGAEITAIEEALESMPTSYIWGNLAKATNDPTRIDEAIAEAVVAHNDDPDAHLGQGQALESHRAAEIIDHRAESVVNDKIQQFAKPYVALVGTGVEGDFDTIAEAVTFANGKGGGTIFLTPGTHYLSGEIEMVNSVNIVGSDADNTKIVGGQTSGDFLRIIDDVTTEQQQVLFSNLSLESTGGAVIRTDNGDLSQESLIKFDGCSFVGGNTYLHIRNGELRFEHCFIEAGGDPAFFVENVVELFYSKIQKRALGSSCTIFSHILGGNYEKVNSINYCRIDLTGTTTGTLITGVGNPNWSIMYSDIQNWRTNPENVSFSNVIGNQIQIATNQTFGIYEGYSICLLAMNYFFVVGTGKIVAEQEMMGWVANYYPGPTNNISPNRKLYDNLNEYVSDYPETSISEIPFLRATYFTVKISANKTLTCTVPQIGEERTLVIVADGSTSRAVTFGGNFRAASTLNTGTTSGRQFIIKFVSNGTRLIETSRTVGLVV